ncbi:MAG TPA: dienelactone hydrolase family protein [Casimicrobiaceae bacterium]
MRTLILGAALALSFGQADAAIKETPVTYKDGTTTLRGFVVYDDATRGKRPGVIVVPEWWGITKHVHGEAQRLAGQGYTAFIADMYGEGKTADNPKDADALSSGVMKNSAAMQSRFNAAKDALAKHATVDRSRIAAIGFCFGGAVVLNMARAGSDLKGVAAFHAGLGANVPAATPGKVKGKVLVLNGADDPFIKTEEIGAFKQEMQMAKVDYRYVDYPGAVHAFTNPDATAAGKKFGLPLKYDAKADKQSKAEATKFLAEVLKK